MKTLTVLKFTAIKYWKYYIIMLPITLPLFLISKLLLISFSIVWIGLVSIEEEIRNPPSKFLPLPLNMFEIAGGRLLFKVLSVIPYCLVTKSDVPMMVSVMSEIYTKKFIVPLILLYPLVSNRYFLWIMILLAFVCSSIYEQNHLRE